MPGEWDLNPDLLLSGAGRGSREVKSRLRDHSKIHIALPVPEEIFSEESCSLVFPSKRWGLSILGLFDMDGTRLKALWAS